MHFYDKLLAYRNSMGLTRNMGIRILEIQEGYVKGEMLVSASQQNLIGSVHGGVLMTFADIVGAAAAWSYGEYTTTMNCSVNFLNAATDVDRLYAEAEVKNTGQKDHCHPCCYQGRFGQKNCWCLRSVFSVWAPHYI